MIPDEEVERVLQAADIVQIIGEYVPLKRSGNSWRAPCPFHQGTHPNFSVRPGGGYTCFVCGEKGSVFTFLQKRLGLSFPDAVKLVGAKSGIEVREVTTQKREGPDPREPLWEANASAQLYFQRMLWDDPMGAAARDYLASRGVSREMADRFGLGFAPREIGLMRAYLATLGFDDVRLLEAGLLVQRDENEEPRPRFRARLIFPIHDASGRIAGFGGRLIGPGEPKYLNSAESPIYSKGRLLYNLHQARNAIRRDERVLVVEGYFDALRLVVAGIECVVAPLGTALTEEQAAILVRYTKNVFLLYDSDKAGLKATFRAGDALLAAGATVRVVTLPEGEDPDTYVREHGREGMERHIAQAMDVFDRKVQLLERGGWFADLTKRRSAIDRLLPTIRATVDPVLRDLYVARASDASGVDRAVLAREAASDGDARRGAGVRRDAPRDPAPDARTSGRGGAPDAPPPDADADRWDEGGGSGRWGKPGGRWGGGRAGGRRGDGRGEWRRDDDLRPRDAFATPNARGRDAIRAGASAERYLLAGMLRSPLVVERVLERLGEESFRAPLHREIFLALRDQGGAEPIEELADRLSPEGVALINELLAAPESIMDLDRTVEHSLARLDERRLHERNEEIDREIRLALDEEKDALMREKHENTRQLRELRALRESQ